MQVYNIDAALAANAALAEGDRTRLSVGGVAIYTASRGIWEGDRMIRLPNCQSYPVALLAKCKTAAEAAEKLWAAEHESYPSGGWSVRSLPEATLVFRGEELFLPAEDNRACGRVGIHGV